MKQVLILSPKFNFASKLTELGYLVIETSKNAFIDEPVAFHSDMQLFAIFEQMFILYGSEKVEEVLNALNINYTVTNKPDKKYPKDVLCNGKLVGNNIFLNEKTIDNNILNYCKETEIKIINVNQGYTGCSICAVNDNSIITADKGIAHTARNNNFDVLLIEKGHIKLQGYDYGFIGGASGLVDNKLFFTGSLLKHPSGTEMYKFIRNRNVEVVELSADELIDIGGINTINKNVGNYTK